MNEKWISCFVGNVTESSVFASLSKGSKRDFFYCKLPTNQRINKWKNESFNFFWIKSQLIHPIHKGKYIWNTMQKGNQAYFGFINIFFFRNFDDIFICTREIHKKPMLKNADTNTQQFTFVSMFDYSIYFFLLLDFSVSVKERSVTRVVIHATKQFQLKTHRNRHIVLLRESQSGFAHLICIALLYDTPS